MNVHRNRWLSALLFTGLGLFAWLLLAGYTNQSAGTKAILGTCWSALFLIVLFNALGFLTLRIAEWLNAQYLLHARRKWKVVLACTAVLGMFFLVDYGFLVSGKLLVGARHPFAFPHGGLRILIVVWLVEIAVLGLLLANRAMAQTLALRQRAAELQRENNTARYTALQKQLNPHFLFNSLNTLIAEIEYDPAGAVSFTRRLSDVYRYVLQVQDRPLVTLDEELRFADAYLLPAPRAPRRLPRLPVRYSRQGARTPPAAADAAAAHRERNQAQRHHGVAPARDNDPHRRRQPCGIEPRKAQAPRRIGRRGAAQPIEPLPHNTGPRDRGHTHRGEFHRQNTHEP